MEEIDLREYPKPFSESNNQDLTIGDLHGNTLKLIYFLIKEGIVEMSEKDYESLVKLYDSIPDLSKEQFKEMKKGKLLNPSIMLHPILRTVFVLI